jgi:hypothetical protein
MHACSVDPNYIQDSVSYSSLSLHLTCNTTTSELSKDRSPYPTAKKSLMRLTSRIPNALSTSPPVMSQPSLFVIFTVLLLTGPAHAMLGWEECAWSKEEKRKGKVR